MSNMIIETASEHLEAAYKNFFNKTARYPQEKRENFKKAFSLNAKNKSICSISNNTIDRDVNASINILNEAQRILRSKQ